MRKNSKKVMASAKQIARKLRQGATIKQLMAEYHCNYYWLVGAILTQMSKREYKQLRRQRLLRGGMNTRFKPGMVPWTKGLKGIHLSPATEFKKGHLSSTHKNVGTISIHNDKCGKQFRWIKVSGVREGKYVWIPYARHIWQQKHGPVPEGYFVVHDDGNTLNDDPVNLQLVDRRGHLSLQKRRSPNMLKRARRRAATVNRRRHAANRKKKAITLRLAKKARRQAEAEAEAGQRQQIQAGIEQLAGPIVSWWECIGCGFEFVGEPSGMCPKCSGFRFARIQQREWAMAQPPARAMAV